MEQLLWIETLVKGTIGLCLLLSPKLFIRLFALPETSAPFWPRLTGAVLAGLSVVIFMSGAKLIQDGIGLGGLAVLNVAAGAVLLGQYLAPTSVPQRRGRSLLGFLALLLVTLAILEIILR